MSSSSLTSVYRPEIDKVGPKLTIYCVLSYTGCSGGHKDLMEQIHTGIDRNK